MLCEKPFPFLLTPLVLLVQFPEDLPNKKHVLGQCIAAVHQQKWYSILAALRSGIIRQDVLVSLMTKVGSLLPIPNHSRGKEVLMTAITVSHNPGIFMFIQPPMVDSITLKKKTFKG